MGRTTNERLSRPIFRTSTGQLPKCRYPPQIGAVEAPKIGDRLPSHLRLLPWRHMAEPYGYRFTSKIVETKLCCRSDCSVLPLC